MEIFSGPNVRDLWIWTLLLNLFPNPMLLCGAFQRGEVALLRNLRVSAAA